VSSYWKKKKIKKGQKAKSQKEQWMNAYQVRLIIFHEKGSLVVVFLHEHHGSFGLGAFACVKNKI